MGSRYRRQVRAVLVVWVVTALVCPSVHSIVDGDVAMFIVAAVAHRRSPTQYLRPPRSSSRYRNTTNAPTSRFFLVNEMRADVPLGSCCSCRHLFAKICRAANGIGGRPCRLCSAPIPRLRLSLSVVYGRYCSSMGLCSVLAMLSKTARSEALLLGRGSRCMFIRASTFFYPLVWGYAILWIVRSCVKHTGAPSLVAPCSPPHARLRYVSSCRQQARRPLPGTGRYQERLPRPPSSPGGRCISRGPRSRPPSRAQRRRR